MMKIEQIEAGLDELQKELEANAADPSRVDALLKRFSRELDLLAIEKGTREKQRDKEKGLGKFLEDLDVRTKHVKEESQELEQDQISSRASKVLAKAADLENRLDELKQRLFAERTHFTPQLEKEAKDLEKEVKTLESDFEDMLKTLNEKEKQARVEDLLSPDKRMALLRKRVAEFHLQQGLNEIEFLSKRGKHFDRGRQVLATLPEDDVIKALKEQLRLLGQDVHHLLSEGLLDKDITGGELPLPYSMLQQWKKGDSQAFYTRLWALNFMLISNPEADPEMLKRVRSLLNKLNEPPLDQNEVEQRKLAGEAKKFLFIAGNGVIRRFLEEQFNGLKTQKDYARLGRELERPTQSWTHMLQVAANIPRLFDLQLSNRFDRIFEKHLVRKKVPHVTSNPRFRQTDDPADLPDVPPEELYEGWQGRLRDGDLTKVEFEQHKEEQRQVGLEKHMEAQVYIDDFSGSMVSYGSGQRWALRNAIFIAALNSYSVDSATKKAKIFPNILGSRHFGDRVGNVQYFNNEQQALQQLKHLLSYNQDWGGTNLHEALMKGYTDIRRAKGKHRQQLKDAKLVVVTDGEAYLDLPALLDAQNIRGTKVVTHVFAVEQQNTQLQELSQAAGPGKAFYYFIPNAAHPGLAAKPPYGKPEEFSPVYNEPPHATPEEKAEFEKEVLDMCQGIVDYSKRQRSKKKGEKKTRSRELNELFHQTRLHNPGSAYEMSPDGKTLSESKQRKSTRVGDIMTVLKDVLDEDVTESEAMSMLRFLGSERAVLVRDMRKIFHTAGDQRTRASILAYRDECLPELDGEMAA